jgi:uncharacterized protein (TIGR02246 family)
MSKDEQEIRELIDEWLSATAKGDLPRVLELMDEDAVFLVSGQPPMRGREAFANSFRSAAAQFRIEGVSDIQEIRVLGEWAYCWNYLTLTLTPVKVGPPNRRSGNVLSIFRKQSDGAWVLVRDANLVA